MNGNSTRSHTRLAAAAVFAFGLATTAPAMADPGNGNGNGHATAPGQAAHAPAAAPAAPAASDDKNAKSDKASKGDKAAKPAKPAKAAKPADAAKPTKAAKSAETAKPTKPAASDDSGKTSDPAGNNGTVKIAPLGELDSIPNNTPHPGCNFQVEWFGFDEGADIISTVTFEEHAPTLDSGLTVSGPATVFVGGDPASGAGTDSGLDGVQPYTLSFTGEPHPKQGFHVKLTVHTPGSQGNDSKSKVFWVEPCVTTPPMTPEVPETPLQPGTPIQPGTPEIAGTTGTDAGETPAADVQGVQDTTDMASNNTSGGVEVQGVQAGNKAPTAKAPTAKAPNTGASVPTAIAAGAESIGLETRTEQSLFAMMLMLLGAGFGRLAWTRRTNA